MNDVSNWILGLVASVLMLMFGVLFSEINEQDEQLGDIQVRVASIDTSLEILLDGYRSTSD